MHEQSESSPFFPVPVRWFELPMNPVRLGFLRSLNGTTDDAQNLHARRTEGTAALPLALSSADVESGGRRVGRLLDEQA